MSDRRPPAAIIYMQENMCANNKLSKYPSTPNFANSKKTTLAAEKTNV